MARTPVAVAGCTGLVGQQFLRLLEHHPWFEVVALIGSSRTRGRRYGDVVDWRVGGRLPQCFATHTIHAASETRDARIVFSALPANVAGDIERDLASRGHLVFSNASALRQAADVPLVIPEVNAPALRRVTDQCYAAVGGGIVTNPNCVVAGLAIALAPIQRCFGLRSVTVVTLQAVSGAGLRAIQQQGDSSNVIPNIDGEDEKIQRETKSILNADFPISVITNRVSVQFGHSMSVFAQLTKDADVASIEQTLSEFSAAETLAALPSAPKKLITMDTATNRPQPMMDAGRGGGMSISIGKVRADPIHHAKFSLLVHNTIRGAAGASLLNAELAWESGFCR